MEPTCRFLFSIVKHYRIAILLVGMSCSQVLAQESQPRLVMAYESRANATVGTLVSEDEGSITMLDLKTGLEVVVPKTPDTKVVNPLSMDEAARAAGLATVVAWKLGRMAGCETAAGKIARVSNQLIFINIGQKDGLAIGDVLNVVRSKGDIVDPDTGKVLGTERARIAQLEVIEVQDTFAKAKYKGDFEIELVVGDEVEPIDHGMTIAVCPIFDENGILTNIGAGLSEELTTALVQKKVSTVERSVIGDAINELLIQNTLLFNEDSAQNIGRLTGANFVLTGKIVRKQGHGDVFLRLVSVETGEIAFAISSTISLSRVRDIHDWNPRLEASTDATEIEAPGYTNSIGMRFSAIPAGIFSMGSPKSEPERQKDEGLHNVRITEQFLIGEFEVTRGQFEEFVRDTGYKTLAETDGQGGFGWNASQKKLDGPNKRYDWQSTGFRQTDEYPATNLAWIDCVPFCDGFHEKKEGRIAFLRKPNGNMPAGQVRLVDSISEICPAIWCSMETSQTNQPVRHLVGNMR